MRPLFHPAIEDLKPEAILYALSDPERVAIFAQIAGLGSAGTCTALANLGGRVIPKSSLSQHMKVLREAGLKAWRCATIRAVRKWMPDSPV